MKEVPQVFDWVTARSQCSALALFTMLVETVDSDVKAMNALGRIRVECNRITQTKVVVARLTDDGDATGTVILERTQTGMRARYGAPSEAPLFDAVPSLQDDGRCRYEIDQAPHELWQVSRRALEGLFFRG